MRQTEFVPISKGGLNKPWPTGCLGTSRGSVMNQDASTLRTHRSPAPDTAFHGQATAGTGIPAGYSGAALCRRWKVGPDKVRAFLRRGELVGVNVAANLSGKPQWRVSPEEVERFERRRSSAPPPKPPRRRRTPQMI